MFVYVYYLSKIHDIRLFKFSEMLIVDNAAMSLRSVGSHAVKT